jgi:hypothetical protein
LIGSARKPAKVMRSAENNAAEDLDKLKHDHRERIKELTCLYRFSKIVETPNISLDDILERTNRLLPKAWQYPEVTCSRRVLGELEFRTKNFMHTKWNQLASIKMNGKKAGFVEVCYIEEKPTIAEGPFLIEERHLIDALAERLGRIVERKKAEHDVRSILEQYRSFIEATGALG